MATSLKTNAYHVLGLDGSATGKQILQRSNEIIQRLKIDDISKYDLDIPASGNFRSEEAVKDAVRRLQTPKARIKEYFFWFRLDDDAAKLGARYLAQKDYRNAIQIWQLLAEGDSDASFRHRRHLAIAYCVALLGGAGPEHLEGSLKTWKSLIESEPFWLSYLKSYCLDGDSAVSDDALAEFRAGVTSSLSDIYAELQDARGATDYVYKFRQFFPAKGEKIEKNILNPVYQAIQGAIETLDGIKLDKADKYDQGKAGQIKAAVGLIQFELNKLVDHGLFDDSETKVMRDRAAGALRRIVLDLHNNQNAFDVAYKLLQVVAQIAGTDNFKSQLTDELTQVQQTINNDAENTLTLEIPGTFGGGSVTFKNDHLIYNNRKMFYEDASRISYHAVSSSINLIPISQSYSYMVASNSEKFSFSFGTTLYIGNEKKKDVWAKLAGISKHLIEPHIVKKLVSRIFLDGGKVSIGGVEFDREGYSRSKMFGGRDTVAWTDTVYVPTFSSGSVVLWKSKSRKDAANFTTIPMSTPNAVVLPELVKACVAVIQNHAKP
jgi:hypothetical protein